MSKPRIITFYLPQYHPIAENDKWWGKDFTDWVNVTRSKPRYKGHYQPQLPSELGLYDLMNAETRIAQAELAKEYGIYGFCYYHYWFNGKMLLEKPFNEVLSSKKPDFPFCLCWANENWTRRWDGLDSEILMEQNYSEYDAEQHMEWLGKAFIDPRYIKIKNKPIFLIYNANGIPDLKTIISKWRTEVKKQGFDDIYLCSVKSIHNRIDDKEAINIGFNAVVEFIPGTEMNIPRKLSGLPRYYLFKIINKFIEITRTENIFNKLPITIIHDYEKFAQMNIQKENYQTKTFPCVIPSWDNSARKKISASIQNNDPLIFKKWLTNSISKVSNYDNEEKIVFINAWNEWAEGCHLEPDKKNGRLFLNAVSEVLKENQN